MILKKGQWPIVLAVVIALAGYTIYFVMNQNYEFLVYDGLILFLMFALLGANRWLDLPNVVLWGLGAWAILHMSGGGVFIGGTRLFDIILLPVSEEYSIFRYDQFMHFYGYFVTTFVVFYLLKPLLQKKVQKTGVLSLVIVMTSLGLGAFYEIIEFATTVIFNSTGVGGYINNSLDLVFDLLGAMVAMVVIRYTLLKDWRLS